MFCDSIDLKDYSFGKAEKDFTGEVIKLIWALKDATKFASENTLEGSDEKGIRQRSSILFYLFIFLNTLINFLFYFIYFWLCRVFVAAHGLSLVAASGGYSSLRHVGFSYQHVGFSLRWLLLLWSMGSRPAGFSSCGMQASVVVDRRLQSARSVVVAHRLSCSAACGVFPDQGLNLCPLHWQADS